MNAGGIPNCLSGDHVLPAAGLSYLSSVTTQDSAPPTTTPVATRIVLFFDGVCGLCNQTVDFLIAHDADRRFLFAPLQGETFAEVTRDRPDLRAIDSVIVMHERDNGRQRQFLIRSHAVMFALSQLGGRWSWLARLGLWIPRPLSDAIYKIVAHVRYRIWGKREACRLPTAEERGLFLP